MNPELAEVESPATAETPSLTAADRCDACGSQAYVLATLTTGSLHFCAHHWTKNREKVEPLTVHVHDETHKLLQR